LPTFDTLNPSAVSLQLNTLRAVLHGGYARILPYALRLGVLLLTLDAVLMGLGWALGGSENVLALLIKWALWNGFLLGTLYSWPLWSGVFMQSLVQSGLIIGGGQLTVQQFLDPGLLVAQGSRMTATLILDWGAYQGLGAMMHPIDMTMMVIIFCVLMGSFLLIAIEVFLVVMEFYLLTICCTILLPCGFFRYSWFLAELAIKQLVVVTLRMFVLAAVVSLISPVITAMALPPHPTLQNALSAAGMALAMAFLCWHAPALAASLANGVAILTGQAALRTITTVLSVASLASTAARAAHGTRGPTPSPKTPPAPTGV